MYAGCIVWNTRDHNLKPKPREQWVIVEDADPAIISIEVAEQTYGFAKGVLPADLVKPKIEAALAEKQEAESQIRLHTQPTPKLPDITTFRDELIQALDDPEIQKTAISGLIDEITVHPTAALDIQCSFKTCFQTIALRRINPKPSYPGTPTSLFHPHAAAIAEPHNPSLF